MLLVFFSILKSSGIQFSVLKLSWKLVLNPFLKTFRYCSWCFLCLCLLSACSFTSWSRKAKGLKAALHTVNLIMAVSTDSREDQSKEQLCLRKRVPYSVVCVFLSVAVQQCAVVSTWLKGEDSCVHPAKCVCLFKVHWKANVAVSLPLISDTVWLLHKADIKELLLRYF